MKKFDRVVMNSDEIRFIEIFALLMECGDSSGVEVDSREQRGNLGCDITVSSNHKQEPKY